MKKTQEIFRQFLVIEIHKRPEQLKVEQLLASVKKIEFQLKSIVISEGKENHYFYYRIGLQTHNASKNTYRKKSKNLFPEVKEEDFSAFAKKGIGSWARYLCAQNVKVLHCSGELEKNVLFSIAHQSSRKKSFSLLESPSKEAGGKRSQTLKYLFRLLMNFVLSTLKSIYRITLNRIIGLTVWFLFTIYIFGYKDAGNITPAMFFNLKLKDILRWLADFQTPGFPPEWREVAAKPPSKVEKLIHFVKELSGFVSWVSSFLSNLCRLKDHIHRLYLWIKDRSR